LLNKGEGKKSSKAESKKSIKLSDPFINIESLKSIEPKSRKGSKIESEKSALLKDQKVTLRKLEKFSAEREKGHINKTKIIIPNNNIKQMKLLLCDLNF